MFRRDFAEVLAPVWIHPRALRLRDRDRAALRHLPHAVPLHAGGAPRGGALPGLDRPDPVQPLVPGHPHQTRLLRKTRNIQLKFLSSTYRGINTIRK